MMTLDEIRYYAEEASIDPNKWYVMMSKAEQIMKEMYDKPERERSGVLYDFTETVIHDMMMSFIFAMSDMTYSEIGRIRSCLTTVDKKWTGPEDEIISGSLVEMAKYDIIQRLESFNLTQLISTMLGLTEYMGKYGLHLNITDAKDYGYQLQRYLTTGEYMDTDEHNGCTLNNMRKLTELHPNMSLTSVVVGSIFDYLCREYPNIYNSPYEHSNMEMRHYAVYKMLSELTNYVYQQLTRNNHNGLFNATSDGSVTEYLEFMAMKPIVDVGLRIVLYGHILNCDRFVSMKTIESIYETLELRRVIENEYIYTEQNISGMERGLPEIYGVTAPKRNPRQYSKTIRGFGSNIWFGDE